MFTNSIKVLLWVILASITFLAASPSLASPNKQRHVLLIHSYHKGMTWVDDITTSVTSFLKKADPTTEFHVEYMDTKRVFGEEHFQNLFTEYKHKYSRQKPDIVIVADDDALRFALRHHDDIFPGIPVVFCGINNLEPGMLVSHPEFTGVLEDLDIAETIRIALNNHPGTRRVYIVNEISASGKGLHKAISKAIGSFSNRVSFTFLEDYTVAELAAIIAKLPANSIILRSAFWIDKDGQALPNEQISYAAVGKGAAVPVYSLWDFYMGLGIVGGKLVSGTSQGESAAQIALRILNGEKPSAIPIVTRSPNLLRFDYHQLKRFDIHPSSLPPGSKLINEPLPFYAINKGITWTVALFTLTVTCISVLLVLNIKSRKLTEKSLRDSKEHLKVIIETSLAGILLGDAEGRLAFCNSRLAEMLGSTPEELTGANYFDFLHKTEQPAGNASFQRLVQGKMANVSVERRFVRKDGSEFWGYVSASRLEEQNGGFKALVAVIADITDLKLATDALQAEKERLAVTVGSIGDGVISVDVEGRVIMLNGVAEKLCGWNFAAAAGKPLDQVFVIINETTGLPQENPVKKALETGGVVELANNTILVARDGTRRVIADSAAPMRDRGGKIIGVVLVFRDMTEKRAIDEELFKARKLDSLGVLAGGIAHDFNNLLTGILGNVSLAMMLIPATEKTYKLLQNAENACQQTQQLTQQLVTFAKGGEPVIKSVFIVQLLMDSVAFVLSGSNVRCEFDIQDNLWPVEADAGQISQVLNNLIINADQAMPDGGVVKVRAVNSLVEGDDGVKKYVSISIEDNGVGISEANLLRIFDPYFTTKSSGSGLGLATVYSVIKRHHGEISVSSRVGEGTCFVVQLPAAMVEPEPQADQDRRSPVGNGRVLVMDDEDIILNVTSEILQVLGYEPVLCRDGHEALALCRQETEEGKHFTAVIMDLTIPGGMGGKEAVGKLRALMPASRVIVSSGYSNDPILASYRDYGFHGAVTKPYRAPQLGAVLADVLEYETQ